MAYPAEGPTIVQSPYNWFVLGQVLQLDKALINPMQMQDIVIQLLQGAMQARTTCIGHEDIFLRLVIWAPLQMLPFVFEFSRNPVERTIQFALRLELLKRYYIL
jgi:hypothetical protein